MGIAMAHQLPGAFGRGIKRDRMIDAIFLGKGQLAVGAIDRGRTCVNEVAQPRIVSRQLQHHQMALDIRMAIFVRRLQRVTDPRLRRQIDVSINRWVAGGDIEHRGAIGDVDAIEGKIRMPDQSRQSGFLETDVVIAIHVVDPDHRITAIEQFLARMKADEPRDTGEHHGHDVTPFSRLEEGT